MRRPPAFPKKNQAPSDKAIFPESDLFPDTLPKFAPVWPNANTLPDKTLARLLSGERLTQISFGFRGWRLAAYVNKLGGLGWPIERLDVPCSPEYGHGKPITEYWLSAETIAKARAMRGESQS